MSIPSHRNQGMERPYLNTRQAAHRLCISARKLEAMRAAGNGPRFRRHGRSVFYHIDDLEAWSLSTSGDEPVATPENVGVETEGRDRD
jgi:hypothetical protein